jgi:hypothetical protein
MTGMFDQVIQTYRLTARHLLAVPLIFALPVLAEAIQHIVEFWLGMFASADGIEPGRETMVRMAFGGVKVIAILFTIIVMARYFLHDFNPAKALKFSKASRNAIVISILFTVLLAIVLTVAGPLVGALAKDHLSFVPANLRGFLPILLLLVATYPFQKKTYAVMAAILDDVPMDRTQRKTAARAWIRESWAVLLVAIAPAMILHYYLNLRAVDAGAAVQVALLALDCLVVGVMAALIAAATYLTYQQAKLAGGHQSIPAQADGRASHE